MKIFVGRMLQHSSFAKRVLASLVFIIIKLIDISFTFHVVVTELFHQLLVVKLTTVL